jgi:tRNA modification GTPase
MQADLMDTIVALATPPGRSGVAVLRLSGPHVPQALKSLGLPTLPPPRQARLSRLIHPENRELIDEGLVLYFPAPHSFTGEDVAELQVHGSRAVIRELLEALVSQPYMRLAMPGEFARQAFDNHKLDLAEVEGLADLIDAETQAQHKQALMLMQGALSERCIKLREGLLKTLAYLEAYLDFPDEDLPDTVLQTMQGEIAQVHSVLSSMLQSAASGEVIREGFRVTLLGVPNAGKSSLLNALAQREIAIVTDIAGTTRDVLEVRMNLGGYLVIMADTAGLRQTSDLIEKEGIRRARAHAEEAHLRLWLFDPTQPPEPQIALLSEAGEHDLLLLTKQDDPQAKQPMMQHSSLAQALPISSRNGLGLAALLKAIESRILSDFSSGDAALLTRLRHRQATLEAQACLQRAMVETDLTLKAEEVRLAIRSLSTVIGVVDVEDLLDVVFSAFCLGK